MAPRTAEQFEQMRKNRKAAILEAALHVFAEEGYHRSSVSSIAKKAGVSKGLMYNYFSSKEEVLLTLMNELFDYAIELMKFKAGEVITDDRFREIIERSISIPMEEPQRWKLYMALVFQKDIAQMMMDQMTGKLGPYMQSLTAYFMGKGYDDPVAMMRIFSATLDGMQMHCMLDPENFPTKQATKFLINQFIDQ